MANQTLHLKLVFRVISSNLFIICAALLVSALVGIVFSDDISSFLITALLSLITGAILFMLSRESGNENSIHRRDAYLTVSVSWLVMSIMGSLPYFLSGAIPSWINALFESVSGFTTTGSSILTDIEAIPKSILFWRSLTHWIGGIGIIVLVIVVMPSLQIGGYQLFTLESSLQEKIQPKIKSVGARLLLIYLSLTAAEVIFLLLGKMDLFNSVCHAFGTVATGGFSPRNSSITEYSPYIQYVIMIFMLLAGTNFVMHYYLFKRDFNKIRNNEELRFYFITILVIGMIISGILFLKTEKPLELSVREGFFQVISIITCTGFATADYLLWPNIAWGILFFAMFLGGSTGSTAGGIKMARHLVAIKNIRRSFRQLAAPHAILQVRLNRIAIHDDTNNSILTFIAIYLLFFLGGSILLVFMGIDERTAGSAVATCMGGIGPGIGTVGPASNFAHLPDPAKLLLSFVMLAGRLEIYTILILFTPTFWIK